MEVGSRAGLSFTFGRGDGWLACGECRWEGWTCICGLERGGTKVLVK